MVIILRKLHIDGFESAQSLWKQSLFVGSYVLYNYLQKINERNVLLKVFLKNLEYLSITTA